MNIVLPQAHPREAHRDADRKLHLPNRRAQDQYVVGRVGALLRECSEPGSLHVCACVCVCVYVCVCAR